MSIGAGFVGTCCPGGGKVVISGSVFLVAAGVAACGTNSAADGVCDDSAFSVKTQTILTDVNDYVTFK